MLPSRALRRATASVAAVVVLAALAPGFSGPAAAAADAALELRVSGEAVATFPAFDPAVHRYAVTTSADTGGSIDVAALNVPSDHTVTIDSRPAPGGTRTVSGLQAGDEVPVFVDGPAGRTAYSFVYLPDEFPTLERVTPADAEPTLSHAMLTLGLFVRPSPFFETAVDANGVPAVLHVNRAGSSMDFKRQPNGRYSVARGSGNPAYPNSEIVEFDEQFREVGRYRTVGLAHTDAHDSILLPDGSRYLMAYEPGELESGTEVIDAVIQHVDADGDLLFSWNSRGLLGETVVAPGNPDYAHINSFQVVDDGQNLLVSFRHLSAVLKIARTAHDGFAPGDIVWRLGGRAGDFGFRTAAGDLSEGPCAQHTATQLVNGNVMVFDNGSATGFGGPLCVDPEDPSGPAVERVPTRVAEWSLDQVTGTATLVRDHTVDGRYSIFAGSAQPLTNGGSVVAWSPSFHALASELGPDGAVRWELRDSAPNGSDRYYTYRAFALDLPDAVLPTAQVSVREGATFVEGQQVAPQATCRDTGGSSLQRCDVTPVDTRTVGTRRVTVVARDGAGNITRLVRRYRVVPLHQPDAALRAAGSSRLVGAGRLGASPRQQLFLTSRGSRPVTGIVRVQNTGRRTDRFTVTPTWRSGRFHVRVVGTTRTSPWLRPGRAWAVAVRVTPRPSARRGDAVVVRLDVRSLHEPRRADTVWLDARR